jgi:lysozyme family protein
VKENFDAAFTALIGNEGGYSNNPADPGGETMYGITKRVAVKHGYTGDMHDLPLDLAKSIAKAEYWDTCNGDGLPDLIDFQVFDASYNSGPERAREWITKAWDVFDAQPEGNKDRIIMRFDAYRLLFLYSLPTWPSFGRGWAKRIANNLLRAAA